MRQLDMHAERYRREFYALAPSGMAIAQQEHRAILDAAKRRDVEQTIEQLVGHYVRTVGFVMSTLQPDFDDFRLREAVRFATGRSPRADPNSPHVSAGV